MMSVCWVVWKLGDCNSYRCINEHDPQDAAITWVNEYGPIGNYEICVSLYRFYDSSISHTEEDEFRSNHKDVFRFNVYKQTPKVIPINDYH